jgi:hypothetical protein
MSKSKKSKSWQDNIPWATQNDVYAAEREVQKKNQDGREADKGLVKIFSIDIGKGLKSFWKRITSKQ